MDAVGLLIAAAITLAIGLTAYRKTRQAAAEGRRTITFDESGSAVLILDPAAAFTFKFIGAGIQLSPPVTLAAGPYRLDYEFPDDLPVQVIVQDAAGGAHPVIQAAGTGTAAFRLDAAGDCRLRVTPIGDDEAAWALAVRPRDTA
jgi:hypothetical protein